MAVRSLTPGQASAVQSLVEANRIEVVPVDPVRASAFLRQAGDRLGELVRVRSVIVRHGIAYDAAHDVGECLLAVYGYRTRSGSGQHEAVGRFLKAVLDGPPGERAAAQFDRLRRARNRDRYHAVLLGAADAQRAERAARGLFEAAVALGIDPA